MTSGDQNRSLQGYVLSDGMVAPAAPGSIQPSGSTVRAAASFSAAGSMNCCGFRTEEDMVMGYVGSSAGSYIQETTYKYVGKGNGQYDPEKKRNRGTGGGGYLCCGLCCGLSTALGVTGVAWLIMYIATTTTTRGYDCNSDQVLWSTAHTIYCCSNERKGCLASLPFDCDAGLANSVRGWSPSKQDWCCKNEMKGCETQKALLDYDCDAGLSNWEHGWSDNKKAWCCANEHKGCSPTCMTEHCDATCYHDVDNKGHGHVTCRDRVNWAKDNSEHLRSKTLEAAIDLVNTECSCQCGCTSEDFGVAAPVLGTCLIWGELHHTTFDGASVDYFGEGVFWLVKSATVSVQARYKTTPHARGLSSPHDIVFSGDFLGGHMLKIGPMNGGKIKWDGAEILTEFGTFDPDGYGKLIYDNQGQLVDTRQAAVPLRIVHINFPGNFFAQVFRWENHVNIRIRMPKADDQDGHCGNFNGVQSDDQVQAVESRIGAEVGEAASLFDTYTPRVKGQKLTFLDCDPARAEAADEICKTARDSLAFNIANKGKEQVEEEIIDGCMFDVCFAGQRYAAT
eukprot:CAMPEP_0206595430 /NCGR_PEP_ID=MMETSP0325_2-20121206/42985_1 /ASSEMBLY_ACC=CAM_ASM_000347 /TAXON_ID=2866 /ORGANISM="Crypthecodinium cohnii, Strain Seligo" /LENGTH=564 /DNA_ID=CAMNT_0054106121 /DNA_START=122 /DNA_END=1812 /DNA_ORIENTATION=+